MLSNRAGGVPFVSVQKKPQCARLVTLDCGPRAISAIFSRRLAVHHVHAQTYVPSGQEISAHPHRTSFIFVRRIQ